MINRIVIKSLFGLYNYDISIKDNQSITILTGPNGYGKTTILNIIENAITNNFWYYFLIDFKSITITIENGNIFNFHINKLEDAKSEREDSTVPDNRNIEFSLLKENEIIESFILKNNYIDHLRKLYSNYLDENHFFNDPYPTLEDYLKNEYNIDSDEYFSKDFNNNIRIFFKEFNLSYIHEQRILNIEKENRDNEHFEIDAIAHDLRQIFNIKRGKYVNNSLSIDTSFIKRLVETNIPQISESDFKDRVSKLKKKLSDFNQFGLVSETKILDTYPSEYRNMLSLYLKDMEDKLSVYDSFYERLSLFDEFISKKNLSHKSIKLNSNNGIAVYNSNGVNIPLSKLSSGEQNLIILYYKLIFKLNSRSILLLDEPENSLHIAWQCKMLNDYIAIANTLKCQIFIATHSSAFIDNNWDMTYDLFENAK